MAPRRIGWVLLPAAALLAVSASETAMRADEPAAQAPENAKAKVKAKAKAKAKVKAGANGLERAPSGSVGAAAEILQDLQAIATAVERANRDGGGDRLETVLAGLGLPPRTVTPPTLTAADVDALIEKTLAESKTPTARPTTDEAFLRRVCLDVIGKPPTPEQIRAFVLSKKPSAAKRREVIDQLLDSPDYATNWARYWRDVVKYRATVENARLLNFPKFEEWLAEQFAVNKPWDEIAAAIIAATGNTDEHGAAVFTAAHMAQPNEVAGEVSRVFLGVQIQCAECHDHPSDIWKREQFHQFAAFFAGVQFRRNQSTTPPSIDIVARRAVPNYTMPDLKDPQKSIRVEPRFFLASSEAKVPARLTAEQRRQVAAAFVTAQDNPWFARAFVNRIWYVLLGDGFYNPVDDLGPTREANHPEVLDALAGQFQQGGYDIKWLFRTILNTKAYQRESRSTASVAGRTPLAANCASRLRADQIYDALEALGVRTGPAPGLLKKSAGGQGAAVLLRRGGPRALFDVVFGVDPSVPNEDVLGTIPQALFLMNSPQVHNAVQARPGSVLGEILGSTPDNRAALEQLYLRVLSRRPTLQEIEICGEYVRRVGNRREGFEDIFWSLLNSTEFLSRR